MTMQRRLAAGSRRQARSVPDGPEIPKTTEQRQQQYDRQGASQNGDVTAIAGTRRARLAEQRRLDFDFQNGSQSERSGQWTAQCLAEVASRVGRCLGEDGHLDGVVVAWLQVAQQHHRLWPARIGEEFPQTTAQQFDRRAKRQGIPAQQYRESGAGRPGGGLSGPAGRWSR